MHIFTRTRRRRGFVYKLSTLVVRVYTRPNGIQSLFHNNHSTLAERRRRRRRGRRRSYSPRRRRHDNIIIIDNNNSRRRTKRSLKRTRRGGRWPIRRTSRCSRRGRWWWHNIRHDTPLQRDRIDLRRGVLMRNDDGGLLYGGGARSGEIPIHNSHNTRVQCTYICIYTYVYK